MKEDWPPPPVPDPLAFISVREEALAARIRLRADKRLNKTTPNWIRELAGDDREKLSLLEWMKWAWRNWRADS